MDFSYSTICIAARDPARGGPLVRRGDRFTPDYAQAPNSTAVVYPAACTCHQYRACLAGSRRQQSFQDRRKKIISTHPNRRVINRNITKRSGLNRVKINDKQAACKKPGSDCTRAWRSRSPAFSSIALETIKKTTKHHKSMQFSCNAPARRVCGLSTKIQRVMKSNRIPPAGCAFLHVRCSRLFPEGHVDGQGYAAAKGFRRTDHANQEFQLFILKKHCPAPGRFHSAQRT